MSYNFDLSFYKDKRVFITGHTGFKGSWLCRLLQRAGAHVSGYSLQPDSENILFKTAADSVDSTYGDIRDFDALQKAYIRAQPEIIFHLAAQTIVREGYQSPMLTYSTNVTGTLNLLECIRLSDCTKSFVNVTTDKVYENKAESQAFLEGDPLDGYDPYSNSKSCSELITHSYDRAYFSGRFVSVSTARAGNVIGGGDFARDRIIPDCVRAAGAEKNIVVRNPYSIRPYQHVLDPLYAYLMIAAAQYNDQTYAGCYNVGPDVGDCRKTGELVDLFVARWGRGLSWYSQKDEGPHEANTLRLDCTKLQLVFEWQPRWNIEEAVQKTVDWYQCWHDQGDVSKCMQEQIEAFLAER